uniref:Uncharacterized protein n=1 Tax=Arundo donax TaxID=35708 RepID=A0A0A8ZNS3_ARUDO
MNLGLTKADRRISQFHLPPAGSGLGSGSVRALVRPDCSMAGDVPPAPLQMRRVVSVSNLSPALPGRGAALPASPSLLVGSCTL